MRVFFAQFARKDIMKRVPTESRKSELDRIIPPEIAGDELFRAIARICWKAELRNVLEIGSSAGGGSTSAFAIGLSHNPGKPRLFCLEISKPRFEKLRQAYASFPFVHCYNASSVPASSFPSAATVTDFYCKQPTNLNKATLETVLGWLEQDIHYVTQSGVPQNGIELIKADNQIETFDMVLIDGSEFSGESEMDEVYGAGIIALDDVNAYKNANNYVRLKGDAQYRLLMENLRLRNGFAIFQKRSFSFVLDENEPMPFALPTAMPPTLARIVNRVRRVIS